MSRLPPGTPLAGDWHPGMIPDNAWIDATAYLETTYSFERWRSREPNALEVGRGAAMYLGTMFDLGPRASVRIGSFALVTGVWFICDASIEIGDYSMLSWNVVLMDTYRASRDPERRRADLRAVPGTEHRDLRTTEVARPIRIGANVWIGFDAVVMPGVTIGDGAIVGARSVVFDDVPAGTLVAGNPARIVRRLDVAGSEGAGS